MPKMKVIVSHGLEEQEALARIKSLLGELKNQHGNQIQNLQENWSGNVGTFSFSTMGFSISGKLVVKGEQVELSGNMPFAALPFRGKIQQLIRERAVELLAS